jgi:hypothetical protein
VLDAAFGETYGAPSFTHDLGAARDRIIAAGIA